LIAGCGGGGDTTATDCFYVRLKKNPTTLDPALIVDVDGARIAAKLFNGLVRFDTNLFPIPDLAASWKVSSDGLLYRFTLRKDARFFNGRTVTARDVRYSVERVLHPGTRSPRTWVFSRIRGARRFMRDPSGHVEGIRIRGPHELEIILEEPFAPFISFLGLTTAYVVPREAVEKWGADFGFHAGGTGPFTLTQWRHNQYLQLTANPFFYRAKPRMAGIRYKVIPENFTALVEFEKGDLDLLPEIMASEYARFARDPAWKPFITMAPSLNTYYLGLNCQMPPFDDIRVRQALNLAVDRETILEKLLEGRGAPARGPLPPLLGGSPLPGGYRFDPARARELLQDAGYADGFSMTIYQAADIESLDILQVVQEYLNNVGIRAGIVQLEWSTFLETVARGDAQAFWLSWWADYPEGENFLFPLFHSRNWGAGGNRSRFKDSRIDELISAAVRIMDEQERRTAYRRIEQLIIDQAPWVFFWHKASCAIHQPRVKGFTAAPLAVMETWDSVALERQ